MRGQLCETPLFQCKAAKLFVEEAYCTKKNTLSLVVLRAQERKHTIQGMAVWFRAVTEQQCQS